MKVPRDAAAEHDESPGESSAGSARNPQTGRSPGEAGRRLEGLLDVMDRLLSPDGCAWDRDQTLASLRPYLLEETYEVLEAMENPTEHCGELGDLLFQIVFQAALRAREGTFDLGEVITAIHEKLVRRHPHVFDPDPTRPPLSPAEVARNWEAIKRAERGGANSDAPVLGRLPRSLPALVQAFRVQDKASSVGFDWPRVEGAIAKFHEEWREFEAARESGDPDALEDEYGDLLFVLVRIGQKLGLRAEDALLRANRKFVRRFEDVAAQCRRDGIAIDAAGLSRLEAYWQSAKLREGSGPRGEAAHTELAARSQPPKPGEST